MVDVSQARWGQISGWPKLLLFWLVSGNQRSDTFKTPDEKQSFVVLPGIRHVHNARLQEMIGLAPSTFLAKIEQALLLYLKD